MSQGERPAAASAGDASFEEFVAGSSAHLFTLARLLTGGHRAEAEDLLQSAYERTFRHWKRISRREDPERYVRQALINASVDRWRRLRRRPEEPMRFPGGEPPVADRAAEIADRDLLLRGLAALPVRQRAVLVLRYFEDLTEAQTAEALGCSVGTVKSQAACPPKAAPAPPSPPAHHLQDRVSLFITSMNRITRSWNSGLGRRVGLRAGIIGRLAGPATVALAA